MSSSEDICSVWTCFYFIKHIKIWSDTFLDNLRLLLTLRVSLSERKERKKVTEKKSMSQRAYRDVEADMANSTVDIVTWDRGQDYPMGPNSFWSQGLILYFLKPVSSGQITVLYELWIACNSKISTVCISYRPVYTGSLR